MPKHQVGDKIVDDELFKVEVLAIAPELDKNYNQMYFVKVENLKQLYFESWSEKDLDSLKS